MPSPSDPTTLKTRSPQICSLTTECWSCVLPGLRLNFSREISSITLLPFCLLVLSSHSYCGRVTLQAWSEAVVCRCSVAQSHILNLFPKWHLFKLSLAIWQALQRAFFFNSIPLSSHPCNTTICFFLQLSPMYLSWGYPICCFSLKSDSSRLASFLGHWPLVIC